MKTLLSFILIILFSNLAIAQTTAIPDVNFEQALINLGLDSGSPDGVVLTANIDTVTALNVTLSNISSLSGIEDFTSLTELNCPSNQISNLNISQNTSLIYLDCLNNSLTTLDVSQNTSLTSLYCENNLLTSLNVSQNTNLINLGCSDNQLNNIDLSLNTVLSSLECFNNNLISLDVAQNVNLTNLGCSNNSITNLNLAQNTVLFFLNCSANLLNCLNVKNGNNTNIQYFFATNNSNLNCIDADDVIWSNTNWTNIDAQTSFSTGCPSSCTVGFKENTSPNISLYPNPTTGKINIDLGEIKQDVKATLTNNLGQVILSENYSLTNFISLDINAPSSIYFLQIESNGEVITKKIIKE
jgi:hypothetical protein